MRRNARVVYAPTPHTNLCAESDSTALIFIWKKAK